MNTSVIGFPRVGRLRELKFATEKYFRNEITEEELKQVGKEIRITEWRLQKENKIDYIPSNDFSFYDGILDAAMLFNIIPERYQNLDLSSLDTYFAMARGYQGKHGDVKALAMKKWFNTNYHYMVPEIEDDTEIKLVGSKIFDEYSESKKEGIETKPVITGPFTLLKLSRYTGKKSLDDFIDSITGSYKDLLKTINCKWIQFDEPYLVYDLSKDDIELFIRIYKEILSSKGDVKVLLQTYFGDIRDIYEHVIKLSFDGIGLDFVEGIKNRELVSKYGLPKDKILFAGVINGKNIWKNNYYKTLKLVEELKDNAKEVIIGTSCSLLHVPYTLKNETKLSDEIKRYFSFAEEKLSELSDLKTITMAGFYEDCKEYKDNISIFKQDRKCTNSHVTNRVNAISKDDFTREPVFSAREVIQKKKFNLPLFPTTTIGSFPQTAEIKSKRKSYKNGEISKAEYIEFNRKKIAECVAFQEKIGLDVLVHGEYERNDMVEYFGEQLEGYVFTEKAWVQSYGTRCVKPPIIWGDISRNKPLTVEWSVYAKSLTTKKMKGMLTGPVTILNWSFPREDISLRECAYQIALAIRDEVLDLEKNGIEIIQVDEAALREKLPLRKSDWYSEYLDWAIKAFRLVHSRVKPETQIHTHMCYSEFTDIIPAIDDMDADVITFEASRSDLLILDALKANNFKTEVGPGVYDIHSPRVPSVSEITYALSKMVKKINPEKLWVNPDCGLKTRGINETTLSLKNMVEAASEFRKSYKK